MQGTSLRVGAIVVFVGFSILTAIAIATDGSNGFTNAILYNWLAFQIWLDLVIAMVFWAAWVVADARAHGKNPWAWVVTGFLFGAFVPLLYLIVYRRWPASPAEEQAVSDGTTSRRLVGVLLLILLAAVTAIGLVIDGDDFPGAIMASWSNTQIWVDLVIVILLWIPWMVRDARANGRSAWGWVVLALSCPCCT